MPAFSEHIRNFAVQALPKFAHRVHPVSVFLKNITVEIREADLPVLSWCKKEK